MINRLRQYSDELTPKIAGYESSIRSDKISSRDKELAVRIIKGEPLQIAQDYNISEKTARDIVILAALKASFPPKPSSRPESLRCWDRFFDAAELQARTRRRIEEMRDEGMFETPSDLIQMLADGHDDELLRFPGFGPTSMDDLRSCIAAHTSTSHRTASLKAVEIDWHTFFVNCEFDVRTGKCLRRMVEAGEFATPQDLVTAVIRNDEARFLRWEGFGRTSWMRLRHAIIAHTDTPD